MWGRDLFYYNCLAMKKTTPQEKPASKSAGHPTAPVDLKASPMEAPRRERARARGGFPIVGIGASAGGLEALDELLENLAADTGMAFVVVTHQHPGHTSLLPELLSRETEMPVSVAEDGTRLEPNHVYIAPPGCQLATLNGTLHRMDTDQLAAPRFPVDYFFHSLADDQQESAICIVLSGTGTDGTLGLKAIKGASGMAMVQQSSSAQYAGMPSSAEATGMVDYVLAPAEMPQQLVAYAKGPFLAGGGAGAESPAVLTEPMQKVFLLLRDRTGHDFSGYKISTIRRRIERRMNVQQIKDPEQYLRYLRENQHEIDLLFKDLLISVTSFFRDSQAWEALAAGPLLQLIESRQDEEVLRAWVPGCATGEEVYSLAIVLRECLAKSQRHFEVQIFGTDLDSNAVDFARGGNYPNSIAVDVSPQRLEGNFTRDETTYRVRKEIREMAVFALQDVIRDPPFTKLDLLSCRNLMIYLEAHLQKQLLPIFHYALKPGGLLFLGPSETTGGFSDLFETVDKKWKIYRRKEVAAVSRMMPKMPISALPAKPGIAPTMALVPQIRDHQIGRTLERLALSRFCPAFVVVNDRGDIVHVHGSTGDYLELAEGKARTNLLDMAREGLPHELAAAIRKVAKNGVEVVREPVRVKTNGDYTNVSISIIKLADPEAVRGLIMVTFRPLPPPAVANPEESSESPDSHAALQSELQFLKESYQTTLEELETSNEEMQSTNEEMQSANEELGTSKEEMQSLNEELTTVNAELESKVEDLSLANNDLQNLLNSTEVATIFLDKNLNIKRYTDRVKSIVMLRPTDIGRPLGDLVSKLKDIDLIHDCREVLDTLVLRKREVETTDGEWHLMRIMPYRTTESVIDGVVLTFVSITELKEAEKTSQQRMFFETIFETVRQPLLVIDTQQVAISANRSFYELFRLRPQEVEGIELCELGDGDWDIKELRELIEDTLPGELSCQDFKLEHDFSKVGHKILLLNARSLGQGSAAPEMVLLALEDVTDRFKRTE